MAKQNLRFEYSRLAEVLQERGLVDGNVLRELLGEAANTGRGFCEALVDSGYVADWDLSRVICEIYQLPFLPVGVVEPDPAAWEGMDTETLRTHALVPLGRFGQVLTISMPGVVPADVLGLIAAETDLVLLPVVGTAKTNRTWVEENLRDDRSDVASRDWSNMFDDADAAVHLDLGEDPGPPEPPSALPTPAVDDAIAIEAAAALEFSLDDDDSAVPESTDVKQSSKPAGLVDLPPLPEFE